MQRLRGLRWLRRNPERGGAAVEFALVLPLFCAVLFGTIDYGWYFFQRFSLAAAVRDGLRTGVTINQTLPYPNDPATVATTRAQLDLNNANMGSATLTTSTAGGSPTKTMTLAVTYTFIPLVHFVPLPAGPMKYQMTMMFEQQ